MIGVLALAAAVALGWELWLIRSFKKELDARVERLDTRVRVLADIERFDYGVLSGQVDSLMRHAIERSPGSSTAREAETEISGALNKTDANTPCGPNPRKNKEPNMMIMEHFANDIDKLVHDYATLVQEPDNGKMARVNAAMRHMEKARDIILGKQAGPDLQAWVEYDNPEWGRHERQA